MAVPLSLQDRTMSTDIGATLDVFERPAGPRFTTAQCDALFAALLVHDEIHPDAELPEALRLDYAPEQFAAAFALARQLWDTGCHRHALVRLTRKLSLGRHLDRADLGEFKDVRARFKQLRFASVMCDEAHVYSPALHRLTKTMGQLQDALKNGSQTRAAFRAAWLRLLLTGPAYRRITRGLDRFRPSSTASFHAFARSEMIEIRDFLARPRVTGKQFHDVRKIVSRLVAFYDAMNTLYPSAYHREIGRFVSTINGLMGGMHDGLIERRFSGEQNYRSETFLLPPEIAHRLRTLEQRLTPACHRAD